MVYICNNWYVLCFLVDCLLAPTDSQLKSTTHMNLTFIGPCFMIYFYSKTNEMHLFLKFILLCSSTLHVSDGLSFYHLESKAVHTASGICQTDSADCLLAGTRWNSFHLVPTSKQDCPKHVECY